MNGVCSGNFWPRPLGSLGGVKRSKYHLISITKSILKIYIPNSVCVLTIERYKTYQTGFLFCRLGYAQGVDLGCRMSPREVNFFEHGHVAHQIDGDDERN